jgi:hypothetical protein
MNTVVAPQLAEVFPWVEFLTEAEQTDFWTELITELRRALTQGDWTELKQVIDEWKATAEVKAHPALEATLTQHPSRGDWVNWEEARLCSGGSWAPASCTT